MSWASFGCVEAMRQRLGDDPKLYSLSVPGWISRRRRRRRRRSTL
jgi:hypothetical protein